MLAQAALEQDRKLKRDMVTKFDFLPKQGPNPTPPPMTTSIIAGA